MEKLLFSSQIVKVSELLVSSHTIEELLTRLIKHTKRIIECENVIIWLWDKKAKILYPYKYSGFKKEEIKGHFFKRGEGIIGMAYKLKEPIIEGDIRKSKYFVNKGNVVNRIKDMICVPIMYKKKAFGVFDVSNKLHGKRFTGQDIKKMMLLGNFTSIAISNARLYNSIEKNLKKSQFLFRLSGIPIKLSNKLQLLKKIASVLKHEFDSEKVYVVTYNLNEKSFKVLDTGMTSDQNMNFNKGMNHTHRNRLFSILNRSLKRTAPFYISMLKSSGKSRDRTPFLVFPIKTENRIFILVNVNEEYFENELDRIYLKSIKQQILRLLKEFNSNRIIQDHLEQMEIIREVTDSLQANIELETILDKIVEMVADKMKVAMCSILTFDRKEKKFVLAATKGLSKKLIGVTRLKMGEGLTGWSGKFRKPVAVSDAQKDRRFRKDLGNGRIDRYESLIAHPIIYQDELLGVIVAETKKRREFGEKDKHLFAILAAEISAVIKRAELVKRLRDNYLNVMRIFSQILESKDPDTSGHCDRVGRISFKLADLLNRAPEEKEWLNIASYLHDIGKLGIPEDILSKRGKLSRKEYRIIRTHSEIGAEFVSPFDIPREVVVIIRHHHERYDGTGYPDRLKGKKIPLLTRILAVADSFDAMISSRSYDSAKSFDMAVEEIKENSGKQFDPDIVKVFVKNRRKFLDEYKNFKRKRY